MTLYYEQKHPEFLLKPEDFARNNVRWKPQTRVRMFWRDDQHPAGGECVPTSLCPLSPCLLPSDDESGMPFVKYI